MPETPSVRLQWNHRIHEEWGGERLHFFRLAFAPTYDRDKICEGLLRVMRRNDIGSYAFYQLAGEFDLLLRIWLREPRREDFQKTLDDELLRTGLKFAQLFIVQNILLHHVWGDKAPRQPEEAILLNPLNTEIIAALNDGSLNAETRTGYEHQAIVAPFTPETGIKFFIVIPSPDGLNADRRETLRSRLEKILQNANKIKERSLYEGLGFALFIVGGRVPIKDYFEVHERLVHAINKLGLGLLGIRTHTHLASERTPMAFQERLLLPPTNGAVSKSGADVGRPAAAGAVPESAEKTLEVMLREGEGEFVEFKSSAFVDLNLWLFKGEKKASDKITNEGVVRTVIAFLNSGGGTLVLGILEPHKFPVKVLQDKFKGMPVEREFLCCGVDLDMEGRSWDWFALRLLDILEQRTSPAVTSFVTVKQEIWEHRTVCILRVRAVNHAWFYFRGPEDPNFYVRRGPSTVALSGPDADGYKTANPRPPSS